MESSPKSGKKRPAETMEIESDNLYKFRVCLPNGATVSVSFRNPNSGKCLKLETFVARVKQKYEMNEKKTEVTKNRALVRWESENILLEDVSSGKIIREGIRFGDFVPSRWHILRLDDGSGQTAQMFENMWDLTPDTDLLTELPEEYNFESALADLIDNSLQAVWSNAKKEKKLIYVRITKDKITIFDTGPGMDGTEEHSIVKWAKLGASAHRKSRALAVGGQPPYLKPFFGMFGYGGAIASMHLGRSAKVSAKTKQCKKVYFLHLEREALLNHSGSDWKTAGGIRDLSQAEAAGSPHGSFTKVEIYNPKLKPPALLQLQCKLKDIYFPYIQCDEITGTGRTATPVAFEVNGVDLAEINGGEVGTMNLHSCNGPDFVLQLHFSYMKDIGGRRSLDDRQHRQANARLKCVYFPIVGGEESIDKVLKKLADDGYGITERFDTFSHVSIRRLGRLLPDARWAWLPFMESRPKRGDKSQILKRCSLRVKCFIDTDAGFVPNPSKTDLAHHDLFTKTLLNLGIESPEKEKGVIVKIFKGEKLLTMPQLEKEYQSWLLQMHSQFDEEISCDGNDVDVLCNPSNKEALGISAAVVRVLTAVERRGIMWESGKRIKILKGAGPGCHKNNIFATLEYFLLEGLSGDAGGEARVICRPLGCKNGCILKKNDDSSLCLDLRESLSLPIGIIDSGKCQTIGSAEWEQQVEKQSRKMAPTVEILSLKDCKDLGVDGALPSDSPIYVGHMPPNELAAVVCPASSLASCTNRLDKKFITRDNFEMCLDIKFKEMETELCPVSQIMLDRVSSTTRKGCQGLYIFPVGFKCPNLFQKAGVYIFSFSILQQDSLKCEKTVLVKALSNPGKWIVLDGDKVPFRLRVGLHFPSFSIACYNVEHNLVPFSFVPEISIKLASRINFRYDVAKFKMKLSSDHLSLSIQDLLISSNELDKLRPSYEATLVVQDRDKSSSVEIPCLVMPASLKLVTMHPSNCFDNLLPGYVVEDLMLEMFDAYGNHVEEGSEITFMVDGFIFLHHVGLKHKVNNQGCIDLSGRLQVIGSYGNTVSFCVLSGTEMLFKKEFQVVHRMLRIASKVPEFCPAGSQLPNMNFEIVNSEGEVDESVHNEDKYGESHALAVWTLPMDVMNCPKHSFYSGRCTVPGITIPNMEGDLWVSAMHSRHHQLCLKFKVRIVRAPKEERDDVLCPLLDEMEKPENILTQTSDLGKIADSQPVNSQCLEELMRPTIELLEGHGKDVEDYGVLIKRHEDDLDMLSFRRSAIEDDVFALQGYLSEKEELTRKIEDNGESAASLYCALSRTVPLQMLQQKFNGDVVGLVALLGTVQTHKLSQILAEYLGEDQMLAIVLLSSAGSADYECVLHSVATEFGKSIKGRHTIICMEDIRPCTNEIMASDSQRRLALPDPILPSGTTPPGFLGYAVNMICIDSSYLSTKTKAGYGLRETLFYRLFGKLQIYKTKAEMKLAEACITEGAVSLDGWIMKGNGVMSVGNGEPAISFPTLAHEHLLDQSPNCTELTKLIEEKVAMVKELGSAIKLISKKRMKCKEEFIGKKIKYSKLLDENEAVQKHLMTLSPHIKRSSTSNRSSGGSLC